VGDHLQEREGKKRKKKKGKNKERHDVVVGGHLQEEKKNARNE